jgi:hypothetical protein
MREKHCPAGRQLGSRFRYAGFWGSLVAAFVLAAPSGALELPAEEAPADVAVVGTEETIPEPGALAQEGTTVDGDAVDGEAAVDAEDVDPAAETTDLIAIEAADESESLPRARMNGSFGIAVRVYPDSAPFPQQDVDHFYPYAFGTLDAEYILTENDKFEAELYARGTPYSSYSLFDARHAFYLHTTGAWDFLLGVNTVAWGVTESRHLVDIVNQRDYGGNLDDDEDRLGQPMANLNLISPEMGTVSLFALFGFREVDFPEGGDRLRHDFLVSEGSARLGGDDWEHVVNFAGRYTHSLNVFGGGLDIGLSYFHGLSREPRLVLGGGLKILPVYDVLDQAGVEAVYAYEDLQLKFEGLSRWQNGEHFLASVSGFEYTLHDVMGGAADLGLLAEYLYDGRSNNLPATAFENDVFGGVRLSFNNIGSTRILGGVIVDVGDQTTFGSVEVEHRLRDDLLLTLDARTFLDIPSNDFYSYLETESFVEIGLEKFF